MLYGTPVRSEALCQWPAIASDADPMRPHGEPSHSKTYVDGMTDFDWSMARLR